MKGLVGTYSAGNPFPNFRLTWKIGSHTSLYIGAGAAIVAAIAISWLLVIVVHKNVKRREEMRRILCPQRRYDDTDDIEHALGAEREERERGYAPTIE